MSKIRRAVALVRTWQGLGDKGSARDLKSALSQSRSWFPDSIKNVFSQQSACPSACTSCFQNVCNSLPFHGLSPGEHTALQLSGIVMSTKVDASRTSLPVTTREQKPRLTALGTGWVGYRFSEDVNPHLSGRVRISLRHKMTPLLASAWVGTSKFGSLVEAVRTYIDANNNRVGHVSSLSPALFGIDNATYMNSKDRHLKGLMNPFKERARGYSKSVAMPSHLQKPVKLRNFMRSPGVIGEPYSKPPPQLPFFKRWFTKEGWSRRRKSFMAMIKTSYTIAKLRQKTKGYSQQRFYQEVSESYQKINEALANGERTKLRHLVTDTIFSGMKNELKHRETVWAKVNWEIVGTIKNIRTLQGRLIGIDKKNTDNAFVQMTLRILSKQKFAAYDRRGKLVAGDPDKEVLVEDYWVFEKPLLMVDAKWLLCGRLSL